MSAQAVCAQAAKQAGMPSNHLLRAENNYCNNNRPLKNKQVLRGSWFFGFWIVGAVKVVTDYQCYFNGTDKSTIQNPSGI